MTQLPHPPTFQFDGPRGQAAVRHRYGIGSGNYGYYAYGNKLDADETQSLAQEIVEDFREVYACAVA